MKILMIVPYLPNTQTSGGQTRWYNLVKYLSQKHTITLFSLIKDDSEKKFIPDLKKYCKKVFVFERPKKPWTLRNVLLSVFGPFPLLVVRNWSFEERKALVDELKRGKYDLIQAETFYVMPHLPKTDVPTIQVEQTMWHEVYKHHVDVEIPLFLRPFYMWDVLKVKFWEKYYWKKADRLVAVSSEDKKVMEKLIPGVKVDIIPNGVDSQFYKAKSVAKLNPPRVIYGVTNFEWLQNVEAVDLLINKVWPIIHEKRPDAILWIVGRKIPDRIVNVTKTRSDIETTESIKDARDAYLSSYVMVTPIKGSGGTRLKVLEALAAGLPVVSTSLGVAGLDLEEGRHVLTSDTIEGLADLTVSLLNDGKRANKIGVNGQKFVEENYDWKQIVKLHEPIYKEVQDK